MQFCPQCSSRMKQKQVEEKKEAKMTCPKCGYSTTHVESTKVESRTKKKTVRDDDSIKVLEDETNIKALPTTTTECPKCGNKEAVWWMLQTRSADEPTTQFYRCTKCSHTWRHYA